MECKYFDGCSAPLCPKDTGNEKCAWFADEEVCRLADVPEWVKRQRKVAKKAALGGYFTLAMLKQDCRINAGIKGVDPNGTDKERADDEAAWLRTHPVISAGERERNRALAAKSRAFAAGFGREKPGPEQGLNGVSEEKGSEIPPALDQAEIVKNEELRMRPTGHVGAC
jgi:hypothetical protein